MAVANLKPGDRVRLVAPDCVVLARRDSGLGCEATVVGVVCDPHWREEHVALAWDVPGNPGGWGAFSPWGFTIDISVELERIP